MQPNKKQLYKDYLSKLEEALISDNKEAIDYILEYVYTVNLTEEELIEIDDILQEATLYSEF
jgi:CRISPR/Cas system-associated exonuclease Cas4 (RecB family)